MYTPDSPPPCSAPLRDVPSKPKLFEGYFASTGGQDAFLARRGGGICIITRTLHFKTLFSVRAAFNKPLRSAENSPPRTTARLRLYFVDSGAGCFHQETHGEK